MEPSNEPDAIHWPSGEKHAALTSCTWPVMRVIGFLLLYGDQRKRVKSSEPDTISSGAAPRTSLNFFSAATACASISGAATPRWSCPPTRRAASVLSAMQFTQWACPSSERTSFVSFGAQTLMVRSCEPEITRPSPLHRTHETDMEWPLRLVTQRPVSASQMRIWPSLDAEAKRGIASERWSGSHAIAFTHFLCAFITRSGATSPLTLRSIARHSATCPSFPPEARKRPHGDHAMQSTQSRWLRSVARGVSVCTSHSLTQWSPDPVARVLPSGEKLEERSASA
mmetsp:Transcript_27853/g.58660  ORF Transcript_27853/g.58660 Transcript_27853/m.58660 type:complete len:283 (-) Transcript_27853:321-1169(-)